jgi:hypothetical protein
MPVQLFFLHFRKFQILLIFWYILFATIDANFLKAYGAYSLFLAPEYLGRVNTLSSVILGIAFGVFMMSWNITTFILHGKLIKFLATTAQPFLKYCINNAILPLIFLIFYLVKAIAFDVREELLHPIDIAWLIGGFVAGFALSLLIAFVYFFGADKTIYKKYEAVMKDALQHYNISLQQYHLPNHKSEFRIDWFLTAKFGLRKPRDVRHYSDEFLDAIFKRHHLAAVFAILIAFLFLLTIGFFSDNPVFQIPAAASITVFFAILIAVSGAVSVFLKNWSIPILLLAYALFNFLYVNEIFDPRNKAYGLNYSNIKDRPLYHKKTIDSLSSPQNIESDKQHFLQVLNNWKSKQKEEKPVLFIINVSGGGLRSATFTMNTLQKIDSALDGRLMPHTFLINGASGGMLGATYFRELYLRKLEGKNIQLNDKQYTKDIAKDLLNPLFSSFVAKDILGPVQKFTSNENKYIKDRGYAFEQKLNENVNGVLSKQLKDYTAAEALAQIPTMLFNSVITRDGRKMIICSHPVRFLMKPVNNALRYEADAVDFNSLFQKQDAMSLRVLSALRMNATFPYALPNVWLPTNPVIDVMDAGIRDNFGQESSLRFIETFKDWLQKNTGKVVLIEIRDRSIVDWEKPSGDNIFEMLTRPFSVLQNNWFNIQDYNHQSNLDIMMHDYGPQFHQLYFQYIPSKEKDPAGLSFHLTNAEKKDIAASLNDSVNIRAMTRLVELVKKQ